MVRNAFVITILILLGPVQAFAQTAQPAAYSIDDIQGGWWSACDNFAVEFLIRGNEYFGDFEGHYQLSLGDNVLVFQDGLIDGHSIHVTHKPLSFQILKATDSQLVLRPLPGNPYVGDWHLQHCDEE